MVFYLSTPLTGSFFVGEENTFKCMSEVFDCVGKKFWFIVVLSEDENLCIRTRNGKTPIVARTQRVRYWVDVYGYLSI